jgi:diacylglycerol O-acyltransferase / wax synthase
MANTTPMGFVDRAWLRMDSAANPMVITAVLGFERDGGLPFSTFVDVVVARLAQQPRFRRRPQSRRRGDVWVDVDGFDPRAHVERLAADGPDDEALRTVVDRCLQQPLPRDQPLWRLTWVDRGAAGTAVVARIHHAVGDGVTLLQSLFDLAEHHDGGRPVGGVDIGALPGALVARLGRVGDDARALARLLALPLEPTTPLRPPLDGRKTIAWTPRLSLASLLSQAHAQQATLTDLVLAAFTAALVEEHRRVCGVSLSSARALLPVFAHGGAAHSGNRFGLVFLPVPVDVTDLGAAVRLVRDRLTALRQAPDTEVALLVLGGLGLLPRLWEQAGVALFTAKASFLCSSLPGPKGEVTLAGHRLTRLIVSAPVAGSIGLSVSVISHGDDVHIAVAADSALPHDPAALVRGLVQRLAG